MRLKNLLQRLHFVIYTVLRPDFLKTTEVSLKLWANENNTGIAEPQSLGVKHHALLFLAAGQTVLRLLNKCFEKIFNVAMWNPTYSSYVHFI